MCGGRDIVLRTGTGTCFDTGNDLDPDLSMTLTRTNALPHALTWTMTPISFLPSEVGVCPGNRPKFEVRPSKNSISSTLPVAGDVCSCDKRARAMCERRATAETVELSWHRPGRWARPGRSSFFDLLRSRRFLLQCFAGGVRCVQPRQAGQCDE